jgi:hypothetical protein
MMNDSLRQTEATLVTEHLRDERAVALPVPRWIHPAYAHGQHGHLELSPIYRSRGAGTALRPMSARWLSKLGQWSSFTNYHILPPFREPQRCMTAAAMDTITRLAACMSSTHLSSFVACRKSCLRVISAYMTADQPYKPYPATQGQDGESRQGCAYKPRRPYKPYAAYMHL